MHLSVACSQNLNAAATLCDFSTCARPANHALCDLGLYPILEPQYPHKLISWSLQRCVLRPTSKFSLSVGLVRRVGVRLGTGARTGRASSASRHGPSPSGLPMLGCSRSRSSRSPSSMTAISAAAFSRRPINTEAGMPTSSCGVRAWWSPSACSPIAFRQAHWYGRTNNFCFTVAK